MLQKEKNLHSTKQNFIFELFRKFYELQFNESQFILNVYQFSTLIYLIDPFSFFSNNTLITLDSPDFYNP